MNCYLPTQAVTLSAVVEVSYNVADLEVSLLVVATKGVEMQAQSTIRHCIIINDEHPKNLSPDIRKQTKLSPAILATPARKTKASSQPQRRSRKRLHNRRLAATMASTWTVVSTSQVCEARIQCTRNVIVVPSIV